MEQAFMDIACLDQDIREGITTSELDPTSMLKLDCNLAPFSDQNQSPRTCIHCQMEQTMGLPCHSLAYRPDNKLYKLQTPKAPIVPATHSEYKMDEYYQNGTKRVGTYRCMVDGFSMTNVSSYFSHYYILIHQLS
jgi:DNA-directed RNA polymerase I subunit RPA2